jgi:hypothetical protein
MNNAPPSSGEDGAPPSANLYCLAGQQQKRLCVMRKAIFEVCVLQDTASMGIKNAKKCFVIAEEEEAVEAAYIQLQEGLNVVRSFGPQMYTKKLLADIRDLKQHIKVAAQIRAEPLGIDRRYTSYWVFAGEEQRVYAQTHDGEGSEQGVWGFYQGVESIRELLDWLDVRCVLPQFWFWLFHACT